MSDKTTIQISTDTRNKLEALKVYPRETWDDIINRLIEKVKNP